MTIATRRWLAVLVTIGVVSAGLGYAAVTYQRAGAGAGYGVDGGPTVRAGETVDIRSGNPVESGSRVNISTRNNGDLVVTSSADTEVTVADFSGTYTNLTKVDVSAGEATINPSDKTRVTLQGGATAFDFRESVVDDGTMDFRIVTSGESQVTVYGLPSSTRVGALASGDLLDVVNTGSDGSATFTVPDGTHAVELVTNQGGPSVEIAASSPADGAEVQRKQIELAVNVSDPDFQRGDEVQLRWFTDGQVAFATTVSANGTYNYTATFQTAGSHTYRADVIDAYDAGGVTNTRTINTPGNLTVLNVSDTSEVVTDGQVEIFAGEQVVTRQITSDGNVSLAGLPTDRELTIEVTAADYIDRTIVIDTVYAQQAVYLLPQNTTTVAARFQLDDVSGQFDPDETELRIRRPVNVSGQTKFQTVATDSFGVEGVTVTLERDQRYRLIVVNEDGDTASLGKYVASLNETVVLEPRAPGIEPNPGGALAYDVGRLDDGTLIFQWVDTANETGQLQFTLINNETGATVFQSPTKFELGEYIAEFRPTNGTLTDPHVLRIDYTRNGEAQTIRLPVGPQQQEILPDGVPPVWLQMGAGLAVLMIGGLFSRESAGIGALVTAVLGSVLWWVGVLGGIATAATVTIAVGIGVFAAFGGERNL